MHSISIPLHPSNRLANERDYVRSSERDSVDVTSVCEDLDFADDVGVLSSCHCDIQEMTDRISSTANTIGLKINTVKTKLMKKNNAINQPVTINSQPV